MSGRRAQWVKVKRIELKPVLVKPATSPVAERMRAKYQQRVAPAAPQAEARAASQTYSRLPESDVRTNDDGVTEQPRSRWFVEDQ